MPTYKNISKNFNAKDGIFVRSKTGSYHSRKAKCLELDKVVYASDKDQLAFDYYFLMKIYRELGDEKSWNECNEIRKKLMEEQE